MSGPRVLFYVQYLQGVGHLYRAARIARAMAAAGLDVDIVSGGLPVPGFDAGGARLVQLEPVHCPDGDFADLRDAGGRPADDALRARRRDRLLASFRERAPAAVVIEAFPFGRRQMDFELKPLVAAVATARPRPLLLCSVRDILQANRNSARITDAVAMIENSFDTVLVHGDPAFAAFEETFPATTDIAGKLHYTGLVGGPAATAAEKSGEVVVSAGGGATASGTLLGTAMAARPLSALKAAPWRLLAGPHLPAGELMALRAAAPAGITVEPNRGDFARLLAGCAVSVSQAGYNTVAELLQAGCPAVVVPYAAGGETEQTFRAARLAERKLARLVPADRLTPATLAAAIDAAVAGPAPARAAVRLGGAEDAARYVRDRIGR